MKVKVFEKPLRERLIAAYRGKQPIDELGRKARKSRRRGNIWTVEELEFADAKAEELINLKTEIRMARAEHEQIERLTNENNQLRQDKERLELALAETERRYRMAKGICVGPKEMMERMMLRGAEG